MAPILDRLTTVHRSDARTRQSVERLLLLLAPLLPAAPGLLGLGNRTALDMVASFIQAHPMLRGALILPIETARDAGLALLAGHALLLGAGGLACASLLRTLELPRAALAGSLVFEFASLAVGTTGWRPLLALIVCPAFLAALERCIRGRRYGIARLAMSIGVVCAFSQTLAAVATLGLGLAWLVARLASVEAGSRWRTLNRVGLGVVFGAVLVSPIGAAELLSGTVPASLSWPDLLPPHGWHIGATEPGIAPAFGRLLPVIGLACLALVPPSGGPPMRGRVLRMLLAATALTSAAVTPSAAIPLCLTCLVVLCGVLWCDLAAGGRKGALPTAASGLVVLAGLAAVGTVDLPRPVIVVNVLGLAAALVLSRRTTRIIVLSSPAIAAAAYIAFIDAS